ncbi:peptidase S45 penicillin amidase [mine drainage metagenome]|uniref:Peptidase S45 penicillin amidase n=2 Tax=mine drainage metagenome TaxID=410659 RepID=T1BPM0_9ZZZZ
MHRWLPPRLYRFLTAPGNRWDAPLMGHAWHVPSPPPASVFDLHKLPPGAFAGSVAFRPPVRVLPIGGTELAGSNAFAVSGRFTRTHAALLANDMHLHLALPPIWYRAQIEFRTQQGQSVRLLGVTLPGVPALVVGTNFHVAWGFTNTEGDWVDLIRVRPLPGHPNRYQTPQGIRRMILHPERIRVRGGPSLRFTVRDTIWGPVVGRTPSGVWLVSRWVGEDPRGYRINAERALERAQDVKQAIAAANRLGIPEQNFVTADRAGNIGWSVAGAIPRRVGDCHPVWPQSWARGQCRWQGYLKPRSYPRILDPKGGFIWTANQRIVDGRALRLIGDGGYDLGARARQIRNDLKVLPVPITARDLLSIELDDRARYLAHWQKFLTGLLTPAMLHGHPRRIALDQVVSHWQACACIGSVGYRLVWKFRKLVFHAVLRPFDRLVRKHDPHFRNPMRAMAEGPVWWLVTHEPPWLLTPREPSWHAFLIHQVDRLIRAEWHPDSGFRRDTWGRHNRIQIANPIAAGIPVLGPWLLDLPPTEIPGDSNMPRVQTHALGATERLVVDLGDPSRSLFELPGGESGNPASPYYRDEFRAWLLGLPTRLDPGRSRSELLLKPEQTRAPRRARERRFDLWNFD